MTNAPRGSRPWVLRAINTSQVWRSWDQATISPDLTFSLVFFPISLSSIATIPISSINLEMMPKWSISLLLFTIHLPLELVFYPLNVGLTVDYSSH